MLEELLKKYRHNISMIDKFKKSSKKSSIYHDICLQISLISYIIIEVLKLQSVIDGINPVLLFESNVSAVGQLSIGFLLIFSVQSLARVHEGVFLPLESN